MNLQHYQQIISATLFKLESNFKWNIFYEDFVVLSLFLEMLIRILFSKDRLKVYFTPTKIVYYSESDKYLFSDFYIYYVVIF